MRQELFDLLRLASAGRRLRPVLIVGEARSGTTLLYRLLQQQPAFGPHPVHLVESSFARTLLTEPELDEARTWPMRSYLKCDDDAWARYLAAAVPLLGVSRAVIRARPGVMHRPRAATAVGASMLARAYLAIAAETRAATRLVEKTPYHTPFSGHLLRWFPGARLLYIIRHPVDVITSYWRRAAEEDRAVSWWNIGLDTFVTQYATNTDLAVRWATDRPDAFLILRYEDLVRDPHGALAAVCRFAAAELDPGAVTSTESQPYRSDRYLWGEVCAATKDWRDFIDVAAAAEVERRLAPSLATLGYRRYTR